MAEPHVLSSLRRKYQELLGERQRLRQAQKDCQRQIVAIQTAIKLFKPDSNLSSLPAIRKRRKTKLGRGAVTRTAIDVLRERGELMTVREITIAVCERLYGKRDKEKIGAMLSSLGASMALQKKRGLIIEDRSQRLKRYSLILR